MFEQYRCIPVIWSWGICCPGHQEQNGSQEQIKAVWQGTATWVGEDNNLILSREGSHSRESSCTLLKGTKEPGLTTSPSTQHTINTNTFCFSTSCSRLLLCSVGDWAKTSPPWGTVHRQRHSPATVCHGKVRRELAGLCMTSPCYTAPATPLHQHHRSHSLQSV